MRKLAPSSVTMSTCQRTRRRTCSAALCRAVSNDRAVYFGRDPILRQLPALMAGFTVSLLEKAADSGLLCDVRALYLAPRVVLVPLRRGGKKHEAQARARLRERVEQWPALQPPEPAGKPRKRKALAVPDNVLDPKKEQLVEQAIRDKALSKACMLLTSNDSPITVDVPTEMKKLHPDGEPFELEYIPGQLNFSSSDVERKLKEFPPGSSGGPSGWRGSHLKEMLKAKCKPSF